MNGGIILKLNCRKNFSEKEYADIIRAYNELVRENTRLKVQCQELLNENLKLIKEVDDVCIDTDDIK